MVIKSGGTLVETSCVPRVLELKEMKVEMMAELVAWRVEQRAEGGVHDRMPVILPDEACDLWLDPGFQKTDAVCDLLKPFNPALMRRYEVSSRVNMVKNDDPACAEAVVRRLRLGEGIFVSATISNSMENVGDLNYDVSRSPIPT